ncbi:MAG: hypothetical protein MI757_20155 [Pirellulales bacterium]|nr:hypothetical protein [Pirellulales bacterium]
MTSRGSVPTEQAHVWDITFTEVELTFGYDESKLGLMAEEDLIVAHYDTALGQWEILPTISHDLENNTITFSTDSFSPVVIGVEASAAAPEPFTLTFATLGLLNLSTTRRRRRR